MADFLANLWESVFTPGPTPTLLIATNVTFASLQFLLFGLLIATYSIHFAVLSFLCGGLWYSINWFAHELRQSQLAEEEADRLQKRKKAESEWRSTGEVGDSADDEGEETEVEAAGTLRDGAGKTMAPEEVPAWAEKQVAEAKAKKAAKAETSGAKVGDGEGDARLRRGDPGNVSSSELSTDSEWEKVDSGR
jgi:hypothetical protein